MLYIYPNRSYLHGMPMPNLCLHLVYSTVILIFFFNEIGRFSKELKIIDRMEY